MHVFNFVQDYIYIIFHSVFQQFLWGLFQGSVCTCTWCFHLHWAVPVGQKVLSPIQSTTTCRTFSNTTRRHNERLNHTKFLLWTCLCRTFVIMFNGWEGAHVYITPIYEQVIQMNASYLFKPHQRGELWLFAVSEEIGLKPTGLCL